MRFRFDQALGVFSLMVVALKMIYRIIITYLGFVFTCVSGFGQGTKSDYERSAKIRELFSGKVYKETINPQWFGGHHFWYETKVRGVREYVLVNGQKGKRRAFSDKEKFDTALNHRKSRVAKVVKKQLEKKRDSLNGVSVKSKSNVSKSGPVSPDGRWRAFIKDNNLFVHDIIDGADIQLSKDGVKEHVYQQPFFWSPDSKYVALLKRREVKTREVHYVDSAPDDQLQPKHFKRSYSKPGDPMPTQTVHVFLAGWNSRQFTTDPLLVKDPFSTRRPVWRPDSSGFMFEHIERGFGAHRVIEIQIPSGKTRALIDENAKTFVNVFQKGYRKDLNGIEEIIWRSERDGWNHLYLYDGRSGKVKSQITKGEWVVREIVEINQEKRQIIFKASGRETGIDPYYHHYYRVNFDGTELLKLTDGDGTHSVVFSPDKTVFIDTWSRVDLPPRHMLRNTEDGSLLCELERADAADLFALGFNAPERFVAKDRDERFDIHGIICRPINFDPNKTYPVVEVIYAGPHGSFVPKSWRSRYGMWREELAELGFITVQIDGKGTSNRGREFQHFAYKNINDAGFPDRKKWLREAAKNYPYMDISRVGIYGGSAGGQNAMAALLWHGDFYKAAAADCGCHDNRMDKMWWNEQWMDYPIGPHYDEQSNVTNAHRLEGKLLLTVGELDTNVDPSSTYQVVDALIKADKDFEFLMVPGAGHGVGESKYAARRRMDFFVRHLLGVEPRVK